MPVVRFNKRVKHDGIYYDAGFDISVKHSDLHRAVAMGGVYVGDDVLLVEPEIVEPEIVEDKIVEPEIVKPKRGRKTK